MTFKTVLLFSFLFIFTLIPDVVSAKSGLTLSPLRTELEIVPGTSQDKTLSVTNNNDTPITVYLSAEEFSVINPQYDYAFDAETRLAKWVTFSASALDLVAGETKTVDFSIGVPVDAEPGGRYLSLFATTDTGATDEGATSQQRVGSLLYIAVLGDISRSGSLISLSSPWLIAGPTDWTANIQNTGTVHYRSRYNVVVQNLFGDTETKTVMSDALILPGTVRAVTGEVPVPTLPGIYKLVYTIGLGDTPARVETRYVLYMPSAVLVISIFASILVGALIGEYRSRKKRQFV